MMQFDTITSIYVRHDVILQHVLTFFDSFMKMQGRPKKLFLGSLRASRAINNIIVTHLGQNLCEAAFIFLTLSYDFIPIFSSTIYFEMVKKVLVRFWTVLRYFRLPKFELEIFIA